MPCKNSTVKKEKDTQVKQHKSFWLALGQWQSSTFFFYKS